MTRYVFFYIIDQLMTKNSSLFAKHFENMHGSLTI